MDAKVVGVSHYKDSIINSSQGREEGAQDVVEESREHKLHGVPCKREEGASAVFISSIPIVLSESRLLNNFHKGKSDQVSKRTKRLIHKAVKETLSIIQPKGIYCIFPFSDLYEQEFLTNEFLFNSENLARMGSYCDEAAVFLTTIGKEIDERIREVMARSSHYGYLLNYVSAFAAEEAANMLQRCVRENLPDDQTVTYRYSPGYCDWPVSDQRNLLRMIPHQKIGVELLESSLMTPSKSISGVFGVCSSDIEMEFMNHCRTCSKRHCPHRRK